MKNCPQTAEVGFSKTEPQKLSSWFLNFAVSSVRFLEHRYPTPGSADPDLGVFL